MKNILKFAALLSVCLMAFAGCAPEELSTDQFSDESVTFAAFAPNPVARGGALRITGSNLQKVTEVIIPGIDPITNIEVVAEGRHSEIRVIVPVDGPEVGTVSIIADGQTFTSKDELTYSEPIIFNEFSPANAMPGDVVTIKGDYMNNIRAIQFEGGVTVTEFAAQSRYEMKVVVPAKAITGKIILCDVDENNNPDGLVANMFYSEEVLTIGDPTVKASDRGALKLGDKVTVTGKYLNMIASVNFGGVDVDFTVNESAEALEVMLPETAVDGELALVSFAGKEFKAGAYTTVVPTDLKIAAETRYKAGLNATITGKDLDLVTGAALAGTALEYSYADGKITFAIPAAAVDGAVTLTLANGKTVDTEAITLVKPVITEVTPLELYAGDENIFVKGEDLDLVTGVKLGGKEAVFSIVDGVLEVVTDATSVSGKIEVSLVNGVKVESADEVKINYHSLVVVKEMPVAEHIGATVTLKGVNFMLVENIFVGEAKVSQYVKRTDEEVSFIMPWNKIGSYNIYFHLLNGDVEMLATPIEVLLEIKTTVAWEGSCQIDWGNNKIYVPSKYFEGVTAGTKMRLYYTQVDQQWDQAQINYGDWSGINFTDAAGLVFNGSLVPTDHHGWFADGILDRCDEVVLTQEILDNILAKAGPQDAVPSGEKIGIIIQGSGLTFTKIEVVQEISQETEIWTGDVVIDNWANIDNIGTETSFKDAGIKVGMEVRFYISGGAAEWQIQLFDGDWSGLTFDECGGTNQFNNSNSDLANGYFSFKVTETLYNELTDAQGWGSAIILQGAGGHHLTKITIM